MEFRLRDKLVAICRLINSYLLFQTEDYKVFHHHFGGDIANASFAFN